MTYFFDLDGTLLDHEHAQRGGLASVAESESALSEAGGSHFLKVWRAAESKLFPRVERGEVTIEGYRRERLREVFPGVCGHRSDDELDYIYACYLKGYEASWRLYPDVVDTLSCLKGPRALITNGASVLQRAKISRLNLQGLFSEIYISGELGISKPDPRLFAKACADLQVRPVDVHYVGDSIRNDIEGSAGAGLNPIWINREQELRPHSTVAFREIVSLRELLSS